LPYRLSLNGCLYAGNPVTVQSAGDLYLAGYLQFRRLNIPTGIGTAINLEAGETYSVYFSADAQITCLDTNSVFTIKGERVLCDQGDPLGVDGDGVVYSPYISTYGTVQIESDTRLIANLRQVDCYNLSLNAEDVQAVMILNPDFDFEGIPATLSGEARSGDF